MSERERLLSGLDALQPQIKAIRQLPWQIRPGAGERQICDRDGTRLGAVPRRGSELQNLATASAIVYAPDDIERLRSILLDGMAAAGVLDGTQKRWRSAHLPQLPWSARQINTTNYSLHDAAGAIIASFDSLDAQIHTNLVLLTSHYAPRIIEALAPVAPRP